MNRRESAFIDAALRTWADWLLVWHLPPKERVQKVMALAAGWDTGHLPERIRAPGTHSDPTLHHMEMAEAHGTSWALSIHEIICELPRSQRVALYARAFEIPRIEAAKFAKIKPESMTVAESLAIRSLKIRLAVIDHVRRGQMEQRRQDREAA